MHQIIHEDECAPEVTYLHAAGCHKQQVVTIIEEGENTVVVKKEV